MPNYEGGCETRKKKYKSSVFDTGGDLDMKLIFPDIVETTLRQDMVRLTKPAKSIFAIDMSVLWDEKPEEIAQGSKLYSDLREKG